MKSERPKHYPVVMDEASTLDLMLRGASIARFGDGEWRCAVNGGCTSQRANRGLALELQRLLTEDGDRFLVGIPNVFDNGAPRKVSWMKYTEPTFAKLLSKRVYHSSFITRPDNAPWIDTPEYWANVRKLWGGQKVVLVVGAAKDGNGAEKKSLTVEMLGEEVQDLYLVIGPRQHAYEEIESIEADILKGVEQLGSGTRVLMCLGACATALAWRLWQKGIHALDVGHIGMFMRHAGAYRYAADDLHSAAYRAQLTKLHSKQRWGADGAKHASDVRALVERYQPSTVLDYGCGEGKLGEALKPTRVSGYDPGIPDRASMPKPCDLVVCTDVLEHVEPDKVDAVMDHIFRLTGKAAYLVISTKEANAVLPDGRNAHLTVHPAGWWVAKLVAQGWRNTVDIKETGKELRIVVEK